MSSMRPRKDDGVLFASKPYYNYIEIYTYQSGLTRHSSKRMECARPSTREGTLLVEHIFVSIMIFTRKNVRKITYR